MMKKTIGKVLLIFLSLILVLAHVIVLSVRDARNRVLQEPEPTHRVVISQEAVQRYIQTNNPTSVSSVDGSRSYEFTILAYPRGCGVRQRRRAYHVYVWHGRRVF